MAKAKPQTKKNPVQRITDAQARVLCWAYLLSKIDCLSRPPNVRNLAIHCGISPSTVCEHWSSLIGLGTIENQFHQYAHAEITPFGEDVAKKWIEQNEDKFPRWILGAAGFVE